MAIELTQLWQSLLQKHVYSEHQFLHSAGTGEHHSTPLTFVISPNQRHHILNGVYNSLALASSASQTNFSELSSTIGQLLDKHPWCSLDIGPVQKDSEIFAYLTDLFERERYLQTSYFRFYNWSHSIDNCFTSYLQQRPKRLQNTLKRKAKKLRSVEGFCLRILSTPEEVRYGMEEFHNIYSKSWKGAEAYPAFITELAIKAAALKYTRLGIIYAKGAPIAAQLWFNCAGYVSIFKLAHDPAYHQLSPGTVLTAALMRHVMDIDKATFIDYGIGDEAYKRDWMSKRSERWAIRIFNQQTFMGNVLAFRHIILPRLRDSLCGRSTQ